MKVIKQLCQIQKEIGHIEKGSKNKTQGFMFRGIEAVYNHVHELMAKHDVVGLPEVLETDHEERQSRNGGALIYRIYKIKYTFYADDGTSVSCVVVGEGMDSGDKAGNKAMSIAHKYALVQTFTIPTQGLQDPDYESPEVQSKFISAQQIQEISNTIKQKNVDVVQFCKWLGVADIASIPPGLYNQAIEGLSKK